MVESTLIDNLSIVRFVSEETNNDIITNASNVYWKQKLVEYHELSDAEKQKVRNETIDWLNRFEEKFPSHYGRIIKSWQPVILKQEESYE